MKSFKGVVMIKRLLFLFLLILVFRPVFAQINSYDSIFVKSDWRTFRVHLPKGYTSFKSYPLVLALHGGGGNALQFSLSSELSVKSDSAGFIVVYPEGKKNPGPIGTRTWNAGYCCASNATIGTDDVGFISSLIDKLLTEFSVDTNRIYATGHSNGGMMCYRLATELADKITAVAISSATMVRNYPFSPKRAIPVIHFHSYKDQHVPYEGGEIAGVTPPVHSPPVDSIIRLWSTFNECKIIADTVHKSNTYDEIVFKNGRCETQVNLFVTHDGGHAWPGGKPGGGPDSDTPSTAISANYLLWKFFQQYRLNCIPVTGIQKINKEELLIFPTILDDIHSILSIQLPSGNFDLSIFDNNHHLVKHLTRVNTLTTIDCSDLTSGIYFIEAILDKKLLRCKFVKE